VNLIRGCNELGIALDNVHIQFDLSRQEFQKLFTKINSQASDNSDAGLRTLFLLLFGGHGSQKTNNFAMCNSDVKVETKFPFEQFARTLSTYPDSYVVCIFDACREDMPDALRGKNAADDDESPGNLIMVLGCPPGGSVQAESSAIVEFFQ